MADAKKCTYCSHPLYSGVKCKNCGRVTEQPAQEPVAWQSSDLTGVSVCCGDYQNCGRPCTPRGRWQASIDDTALLRLALEWFDAMRVGAMSRNNAEQLADEVSAALRERLGEKV